MPDYNNSFSPHASGNCVINTKSNSTLSGQLLERIVTSPLDEFFNKLFTTAS